MEGPHSKCLCAVCQYRTVELANRYAETVRLRKVLWEISQTNGTKRIHVLARDALRGNEP